MNEWRLKVSSQDVKTFVDLLILILLNSYVLVNTFEDHMIFTLLKILWSFKTFKKIDGHNFHRSCFKPLFSDADLRPLQLQVLGDEVVVCVVVLDDPECAGVGHVGHHHLLLRHGAHITERSPHSLRTGATRYCQENIFFSEMFENVSLITRQAGLKEWQ